MKTPLDETTRALEDSAAACVWMFPGIRLTFSFGET